MKISRTTNIITIKLNSDELENLGESCEYSEDNERKLIRKALFDVINETSDLERFLKLLMRQDDNENLGELKARIENLFKKSRDYVHARYYITPERTCKVIAKYSYELVNALLDKE